MKLFHTLLIVFAAYALASTLPVRMRTRELPTPTHRRQDASQNVVCAVWNLREAVDNVEMEQEVSIIRNLLLCFIQFLCAQVPCETLSHANIQMLLSKLKSFHEYAIREDMFGSLTTPVPVERLLQVMNDTLPTIAAHVSAFRTILWYMQCLLVYTINVQKLC